MASPGMWQSSKRLYVDRAPSDPKARIVPEDSPQAAFVLVGEGGEISLDVAERLGLVTVKDAVVTEVKGEPEPKAEEDAGEKANLIRTPERPDRAETIQMGGEPKGDDKPKAEKK